MGGNGGDRLTSPVKKGWRSSARSVAIVAVAMGVVAAIYSERTTISKGIGNVGNLSWAWVAATSLIEVLSMVALAQLYRGTPAGQRGSAWRDVDPCRQLHRQCP